MAHDAFISHSSKDKQTADAVCAVLESKSIRCWVAPRDIQPGADWGEAILDGIRACRVMVLVFSKNANESVQIKREVERAIHHGKPIIPLRIEDILPTGTLEFSISTAHWLDAFNPPMEAHLNYLASTVQAILDGKPQPLPPPPAPKPRPGWINLAIAGGSIAALLVIYLAIKLLFPPSVQGTWNLSQCSLNTPQTSVIADLLMGALKGSDVKGQLQVKSLNEYSASITASDSGTVTTANSAITFTSNSTHKSTLITYQFMDISGNPGAWSSFGIPDGDKVLLLGVNAGAGEVLLHMPAANATQANGSGGGIGSALVGTWSGTPFNMNPPNNLWGGTVELHSDGTYLLTATHQESGILTINNGSWSAKPSGGGMSGMPSASIFNDPFSPGNYSFSGANTLNIGTSNGTFIFKRGW
jgi:TIR domain